MLRPSWLLPTRREHTMVLGWRLLLSHCPRTVTAGSFVHSWLRVMRFWWGRPSKTSSVPPRTGTAECMWLREPAESFWRTRRFVCCQLHNVDSHPLFLVRILLLLPHHPFTSSQLTKYLPKVKNYTKWFQLARKGVINNII